MTNKGRRSLILILVALPCLLVGGWVSLYSGHYDPKNIAYVLWKHDLWKIDTSRALSIMTHDRDPASLVVGKGKEQIDKKFGPLIPLNEASAYVQTCAATELAAGNSMMLGKSEWMVTFSEDRAVKLTLVKGC